MTETTITEKEKTDERRSLENFLSERQFSLEKIEQTMGADTFTAFFEELVAMKKILNIAFIQARGTKNVEHVSYILGAGARVQKDTVYYALIESSGGINALLFNLENNTYVKALRDYVVLHYEQGVRACEKELGVSQ